MKVCIYSLFDFVAQDYGPLFEAKNDAVALRIMQHMNFPEGCDPKDFYLMRLGMFDRETGKVNGEVTPRKIDFTNKEIEDEQEVGGDL